MRLLQDECPIFVGVRNAVLAPLRDVGLILVDEEQEGLLQERGAPSHPCPRPGHQAGPARRLPRDPGERHSLPGELGTLPRSGVIAFCACGSAPPGAPCRRSRWWTCATATRPSARRSSFPPCCSRPWGGPWSGGSRPCSCSTDGVLRTTGCAEPAARRLNVLIAISVLPITRGPTACAATYAALKRPPLRPVPAANRSIFGAWARALSRSRTSSRPSSPMRGSCVWIGTPPAGEAR